MKAPRILLAAPSSGSGKTLVTCGILKSLLNRGITVSSFKCGPDYIDPMFHGQVLGISSKNLDTFFTDETATRYLLGKEARHSQLSVMEGVMGYYDGIAGTSTQASAYDLARVTDTPVILIVDARGMSVSITAQIKGFLDYRPDSRIAGAILNRLSAGLYPRVKEQIERELPIKVLGYVPEAKEYVIESRHLGLVTPDTITDLKERIQGLARVLEETVDLDLLLSVAGGTRELDLIPPSIPHLEESQEGVRIGIAKDEAFCFMYRDNLELMAEMGAKLRYFSPVHDTRLPRDLDGMIFYGGYPELYAKQLSENRTMLADIREAIRQGVPYLAECGGFMYLHDDMEDMEGIRHRMVGAIEGTAYRTERLGRFGYVTLEAGKDQVLGKKGETIKAHEFHYFDSTNNGADFHARKPLAKREWDCIHGDGRRAAGFPHLYYYSNPEMIFHFLQVCAERGR
ncbi:MAG: cobyrinate a,c-diamide synthase [Lachnospiraceae bacterium]|jgi:cobyrinic acid a,c-diamide synthase|nr:cobyrinate a,c-diamide synthase [Lachnospiraceae bacterium]